MWTPSFPALISLAEGFLAHFQQPWNNGGNAPVIKLPQSQYDEIVPYVEFTRASYCDPSKVIGWKCGGACRAVPDFVPTLTGGDGDDMQFFYVGYWPTQSTVVVSHQGTDTTKILADLTDMDLVFNYPDPDLFPGVPGDVLVHEGFRDEHNMTAAIILAEVNRLLSVYRSTNVIVTGHSLGGALAELDTLFLQLNLPAGTIVRGVTFGTPRVGNKPWATFFDSQITSFTRVNNKLDPVTIIPGRLLGYWHPKQELHIQPDGSVVICPGDDNDTDPQCSYQMVPTVGEGDEGDHDGPYHGIYLGTKSCTP
ncbi:alpha beta-hydrolase [Lactifluus volemus]|nr:alpha beta-hydrolase [Lactifluus volemus]